MSYLLAYFLLFLQNLLMLFIFFLYGSCSPTALFVMNIFVNDTVSTRILYMEISPRHFEDDFLTFRKIFDLELFLNSRETVLI